MSLSIQSSGGISVVTRNGHVEIKGNVKSVSINGNKIKEPNKNPTGRVKPWWRFW